MGAEDYLDIIKSALDEIPQEYYRLPTTYSSDGIVRERVFCYELYHRMRCLQDKRGKNLLRIHGEIDKRGHELFMESRNPDFVFHVPGSMEENTIIVEVKGKIEGGDYREQVEEDIKTLLRYVKSYKYYMGIFILFNHSLLELKRRVPMSNLTRNYQTEWPSSVKERIIILCKTSSSAPIEQCTLNELLESGDNHEFAGNPEKVK